MKNLTLIIAVCFSMSVNAQVNCDELFFSEYIEGYSQNKALEIYNPTNNTIDLSEYRIERYSNGNTNSSAGGITILSGSLASGDVFVITNGETDTADQYGYCDPALIALGDFAEPTGSYPTPLHMNGNDAIVLTKNGVIIDVIGKVGENPGVAWTDNATYGHVSGTSATGFNPGTWYTVDQTLIRKANVKYGDNNGLDIFDPSLQWDTLPPSDWSNLGTHICDCFSTSVTNQDIESSYSIYPNPTLAGENIIINTSKSISRIELFNIIGEKVLMTEINNISTLNLSTGTYVINITYEDGTEEKDKLIIK
tara:strand:- start:122 stop:1048 length:927 start_codon:yes stop_codon:yes gene_type:complete